MIYKTDKDWNKIGEKDPFHGVLSGNDFHIDRINEEKLIDFYKSGEEWVEHIIKKYKEYFGNQVAQFNEALDFGCGVGRITIPLSKFSKNVVGMDISEGMLNIAREQSKKYNNIYYVLSDDNLSFVENKTFDLVHTFIVLQHIPVNRGEKIIGNLISKINRGGVRCNPYCIF